MEDLRHRMRNTVYSALNAKQMRCFARVLGVGWSLSPIPRENHMMQPQKNNQPKSEKSEKRHQTIHEKGPTPLDSRIPSLAPHHRMLKGPNVRL